MPDETPVRDRLVHEPLDKRQVLASVRSGADTDLRRALVLAMSNALPIGAVRGALIVRIQEALQLQTLPADRVEALRMVLAGLRAGEEVEFPFYLDEGLVTVTIPFQTRY
jgi:hypothetical protein